VLPPRVRFALALVVACAAAGVGGVFLAHGGDGSTVAGAGGFEGTQRPQGAGAAELTGLRDQDGEPVRMTDLRGEPVVMTFVYSTCEDICPAQVQAIRGALDDVGRDVPVIGVSVDPANDTAERARRFVNEQHMTGRMHFMLGSAQDLRPVWRRYGIAPQREGLDHSAYVVLIDRTGRQRVGWPYEKLTSEGLASDLRRLLGEA
jgi:protein SCO1/2